ncbi:MAG: Mg-protoporphyrin IX monomethyl ester oxidative cyclase [Bdellovibrio sp. CG10_big_fil_rev_8_21_14_0_10_47_8]|nr:MAG: Mg-protoporphyrin IX monomethyl ester oxidative cyclase [Bdellovibrio sp. CG10_big_fil_rev_8_21_14_0_10_47_8]
MISLRSICLVTLNSTYQHSAFGLRYLRANLQQYQSDCEILEYTIHRPPQQIVDEILTRNPRIVGFGVYIWNTQQTLEVVRALKHRSPETLVVLGGPEVSYEFETQTICQLADFVIRGEADVLFFEFCDQVLGRQQKPEKKFISGALPEIRSLQSPYSLYSDTDIKNRVIYVEASRGCPYRCEYCLSSLDKGVRNFPIDLFLTEMKALLDRGARQFKFIDRTFNLSPSISTQILEFFLQNIELGLFLHFELVPDRLPHELKELIQKFPAGSLQFEIGIQTWNPTVAALVSRKNDFGKVCENLNFLSQKTGVHTHVDLIAGLPGEDLASFARGFDILYHLNPGEIQVGILKRLKGAPIIRHDQTWGMIYSQDPPFQVLQTKTMSAAELQGLSRFSRFWDQISNSGQFQQTTEEIRKLLQAHELSPFAWFMELSEYLSQRFEKTHSIHLLEMFQALFDHLANDSRISTANAQECLAKDYARGGRQDLPRFLHPEKKRAVSQLPHPAQTLPKRQRLHLS